MELRTYDCPIVSFLATQNTIKVTNRGELDQLKEIVAEVGLTLKVDWDHIRRNSNFAGYACIEYDNRKGTTYYLDEEDSTAWYGEPPIDFSEIM